MLIWYPNGRPVSFRGIGTANGMFYRKDGDVPWPGEPSAIDSSLSVASRSADPALDLGYYPRYDRLLPEQRRTYLEWHANGRTDADPTHRALGYVFLMFYGLERRIIIDGDRDPVLIEELMRLLSLYGPAHNSHSLRDYCVQLLHLAGWQIGVEEYRYYWPRFLEFDGERPNENGLRFILANLFLRQEPLDWTIAYRVACCDEQSRRSSVMSRVREQFWSLFEERYRSQYPEGLPLQCAKQNALVEYRPANSALFEVANARRSPNPMRLSLPNVYGLRRQLSALSTIWNSCLDDLSGYSRAVNSNKEGFAAAVATWQALPAELRSKTDHPLRLKMNELLAAAPSESGFVLMPVATLATLAGIPERPKLTPTQSRQILNMLAGLGRTFAPNPELTGIPLAWEQEVALLRDDPTLNSGAHLPGLIRLLYLVMTVAASNGEIEENQINIFFDLIGQEIKSDYDSREARATIAALRRDTNVALRALPHIAKRISTASRRVVFETLVRIAAVDGEISLAEGKILRRVARAFEMGNYALQNFIESEFHEVTIVKAERGKSKGEAIPSRPNETKPSFYLDQNRISALTAETKQVISLLTSVMDEEEPPATADGDLRIQESQPIAITKDGAPEWLDGLDPQYKGCLLRLIQRDELTVEDFGAIAESNQLLPDALLDVINAWSDEKLGDFLLERGANIRVIRSLLPESALAMSG